MARPLRLEVVGGWYHLTARGNNRRTLFRTERDYRHFLDLLTEWRQRFGLAVAAYVLMPNHYHVLARLERPNLSRAMQWLNLSYGAWFNTRYRASGHVFQGRFHGVLVEGEGAWLLEVSAYIHLNPVRVSALGLDKAARAAERRGWLPPATDAEVAERRQCLREYPWSSYRALAGLASVPDWLAGEEVLRRSGGVSAYRRWVEARLGAGSATPLAARTRLGLAIGSDAFCDDLRQRASERRLIRREHPHHHGLALAPEWPAIVAAVEQVKGEAWSAFATRHGDTGRDLAWWAARRLAGLPLAALAAAAGGVDYSTVSAAVQRLARRAAEDKALQAQMQDLARQLSNPKT